MRYLLAIILTLAGAAALRAQPGTDPSRADLDEALGARIGLIARGARDSVILRWAPSKPGVWLAANKTGYRLERATVRPDGQPGEWRALVDSAIRPWPYELWLAYAAAHDAIGGDSADYPAIAYTLLNEYGEDGPASNEYSPDEARSIAQRKSELDMRFGFAMYAVDRSTAAAEGLGLRFTDRTVTPGTSYIYRVYLAGSAGDYRPDTGTVRVTAQPPKAAEKQAIMATGAESSILLRWRANRYYSSYYVDRSENNGASYHRMNVVPLVTLRPSLATDDDEELYMDSTASGHGTFVYRVYGTTPFADEELIGEGRATTRDVTAPPKPFLPNPEHIAARAVRVRWQPGEPAASDLAGFNVARGGTDSGPFTRLTAHPLPGSAREFIDTAFREDGSNYYLIEALDTAGNASRSNSAYVALIDSTPPGAPRWIDGTMDSNGVVTLRLRANPERDLMGYRLLRANAPDHEFSVIADRFGGRESGAAADTVYRDTVTVQTLTRYVYYRAMALDRNYNESELSQTLAVPRPDVIAPVSPVITDVFVSDTSVQLRFASSSSEDVAYQAVYRRVQGAAAWDSIARTGIADSVYLDRSARRNVAYEYAMLAVDSSGLRSDRSMPVIARVYDSGVRPGVTNLTASYDPAKHAIALRWDYGGLDEEHWFVVYRSDQDGALRSYARVPATAHTLADDQLAPTGSTMWYAVRVVARSGAQSVISPKVLVRVGQ